jgi:hypothetical protein
MSNRKLDSAFFVFTCLVTLYTVVSLFLPRAGAKSATPAPADQAPAVEEQPKAEPTPEPVDEARETFVTTWAERIDAFNAGYPLEGYGRTFAEAAYDYGVDPRYSPAIARVESGSGLNCTYSCNAWGWGSSSWGDWETAIYAHVAGLAQGYGHTVSYEAALSYNELNPDEWYAQVESCMYQIWESE